MLGKIVSDLRMSVMKGLMLAMLLSLALVAAGCGEEVEVAPNGSSTTTTFYTTQDVGVEAINPNSNFDNYGQPCCELRIAADMIAFADFDLSSLAGKTITSATLYFTKQSFDGGADDVYARLSEVVYAESTATWNSVGGIPAQVGPVAQFVTMSTVSTPYGMEATELVQFFTQNLGTVKGFVIYLTTGQAFLQARESGVDTGPYLTVTYN